MNTLIALPAFNESKYIGSIISQLKKKYDLDILVIDDGSTDGTREQLSKIDNIDTIIHEDNLGYGQTIIDAFNYGHLNGYDSIITMDCDGQHLTEEVQILLNQIENCDIVSGSRYLIQDNKFDPQIPPDRYEINMEITKILNEITTLNLTDSFCGFKAYKIDALQKMKLTESGYGMPLQLWIQAWKSGLNINEISVKLIYNNTEKCFNGELADPAIRLSYYKEIINNEMSKYAGGQVAV